MLEIFGKIQQNFSHSFANKRKLYFCKIRFRVYIILDSHLSSIFTNNLLMINSGNAASDGKIDSSFLH
jgi:hypothetical protein